jgi:hypothetical protein
MTRIASAALALCLVGRIACAQDAALPTSVLADGLRTAQCDEEASDKSVVETNDLGGGQSLVEVRCWRAAYQAGSIFFVMTVDAPDKARLLRFPVPDKKGMTPTFSLSSPEYDPKTGMIESFHKGRGVGDCGTIGAWTWSGTDFQLVRYFAKPACDGKPFEDSRKWQVFPRRR